MYSYDTRIRYTECGSSNELTLTALIDLFQNCSSFHSEEVGLGLDYLAKTHTAWFLLNWQVVIYKLPKFCDYVKVCTCPYEFKGFYGSRNFWLEDENGNILVKANTLWSHMDVLAGRPVKADANQATIYGVGEKLEMEYAPRKIVVPDDLTQLDTINVRPDMIDTNNHVNNGQYIRIAMDILKAHRPDYRINQMLAEYKKAAVLGDVFYPYIKEENGKFYVCLKDENGNVNVIVVFS